MSTATTEAVVNSLRVKDPKKSAEAMIPSSFLVAPAKDIKLTRIHFENTDLADLSGCWAWILDGVLSPEECALLVSVSRRRFDNAWDRVLSNEDENWDQVKELTRMCDRAFWDLKPIWERIWKRIEDYVPEVKVLRDVPLVTGLGERKGDEGKMVWSLTGPNERARFIKYTEGEFINSHYDEFFQAADGKERSFFTMHIFLNDSTSVLYEVDGEPLEGGCTVFHSSKDLSNVIEIEPKAGRLILFQQSNLLHSGEVVRKGVKVVMKTDLLYKCNDI